MVSLTPLSLEGFEAWARRGERGGRSAAAVCSELVWRTNKNVRIGCLERIPAFVREEREPPSVAIDCCCRWRCQHVESELCARRYLNVLTEPVSVLLHVCLRALVSPVPSPRATR